MRKGITPIISIIILLLITVGMAATAWTYMSSFMTGITEGVVQVTNPICVDGTEAVFFIKNMGTNAIPTSSIICTDENIGASVDLTWMDQRAEGTIDRLDSNNVGRASVTCTTIGAPKTCSYSIMVEDKTSVSRVQVACAG
ncbi:MAG: hypothetical protein KAS32_03740 [Candidatus Peribacteraceae bacterium]|nr:hypothetical protein [Candidatus Peribacteraceae bacterium]